MALTPEDIETHTFKIARRGYDKVEVDRFLDQVATGYRELQRTAAAAAPSIGDPLPQRVPGASTDSAGAETGAAGTATAGTGELFSFDRPADRVADDDVAGDDFNRLGSEVANVLRTAHHSVATLRQEAELDAAVIRQRAEREIAELRREADDYAARVKAEADAYATERANEANFSRREADRILAEAQAKADANLADTERRIAAINERAEAIAYARTAEIMADANRRITQAQSTEQALREQLIAAHGDVAAALSHFAADEAVDETADESALTAEPVGPVAAIDLTDSAMAEEHNVIDLTGDDVGADHGLEPPVPAGWPGTPSSPGHTDLFGDAPGTTVTAERERTAPVEAPVAEQEASSVAPDDDDDPLADVVKDAIGKAVRSALNNSASED